MNWMPDLARRISMLCILMLTFVGAVPATPHGQPIATDATFERAQLVKPRENTNHALAYLLAPLVLQELRGTNATTRFTNVFFQIGAVQLGERTHAQITYWWQYDLPKPSPEKPVRPTPPKRGPDIRPLKRAGSETGAPTSLAAQGIRLTLDSRGLPVIYEVLGHTNRMTQIYVNQSLETAARAGSGAALDGRQFAIERSPVETPNVRVPRILDDPPAVMGPIVYLHAESHAVATVICRCMASEAKELTGQSFYELVPAGFSGNLPPATWLETAFPRWLPEDFTNPSNRLSRSLRLPAGF
jgi:hypothetical protein